MDKYKMRFKMSNDMSKKLLKEFIEWFENEIRKYKIIEADPEYIRLYEKEVNRLKYQLKNKENEKRKRSKKSLRKGFENIG